ncbi:MAG: hypothetical protein WCO60_09270 [Verrucomicrobiota bacterium]
MQSFPSSTRARYWAESAQEFLRAFPAFTTLGIFVLTVVGIIVTRNSELAQLLIFSLGCVFWTSQKKAAVAREAEQIRREGRQSVSGNSEEVALLLKSLQSVEERMQRLEAAMTSPEYQWERRLYETPPTPPQSPSDVR